VPTLSQILQIQTTKITLKPAPPLASRIIQGRLPITATLSKHLKSSPQASSRAAPPYCQTSKNTYAARMSSIS